jgi:hypothetical protein
VSYSVAEIGVLHVIVIIVVFSAPPCALVAGDVARSDRPVLRRDGEGRQEHGGLVITAVADVPGSVHTSCRNRWWTRGRYPGREAEVLMYLSILSFALADE